MPFTLPPIPILHVGGPEPIGGWYTHWLLDPRIAAYLFVITGLYLAWIGPLNRRRPGSENRPVKRSEIRWFLTGSVVALIALGPPIDDWSYYFFLSAHMLQHLLLMFVVVPCWIKGIPAWVYRPLIENPKRFAVAKTMVNPVVAYLGSSLIVIVWHVPVLYNGALEHELLHMIQHQCFILAGLWIWWPMMSKVPELGPLPPPLQCVYLFLQTLPGGIVGAFITYAENILYPHYGQSMQRPWGIDLKTDQEIGGLSMWVGTNVLFLLLISIIFLNWASKEEAKDRNAALARQRERNRIVATGGTPPGP